MSDYQKMKLWITDKFKEFPESSKPFLMETTQGFKISSYIPALHTRKTSKLFGIHSFEPIIIEYLEFLKETEEYYKKANKIFSSF